MRNIPPHIIDDNIRLKLAEINQAIDELKKWHEKLMSKAKSGALTDEEKELLNKIIKSHNNLHKQFDDLTPSLVDIAKTLDKDWNPKND